MRKFRVSISMVMLIQFALAGLVHGQTMEFAPAAQQAVGEVTHGHDHGHGAHQGVDEPCEAHAIADHCGHCMHCQVGGLVPAPAPDVMRMATSLPRQAVGLPPLLTDSPLKPPRTLG